MSPRFACIVEGHGEVEAVPILVRRIAQELNPSAPPPAITVFRLPRNRLIQAGELERRVEIAFRRVGARGAVLVLIDSDDDCPAELGPELLQRARTAGAPEGLGVVLAKREFEAWFIASAESLRGRKGLSHNLEPPEYPEAIRGAKQWLRSHQPEEFHYAERTDQAALTAVFDLALARRADSFDKCYREIARLLTAVWTSEDRY